MHVHPCHTQDATGVGGSGGVAEITRVCAGSNTNPSQPALLSIRVFRGHLPRASAIVAFDLSFSDYPSLNMLKSLKSIKSSSGIQCVFCC